MSDDLHLDNFDDNVASPPLKFKRAHLAPPAPGRVTRSRSREQESSDLVPEDLLSAFEEQAPKRVRYFPPPPPPPSPEALAWVESVLN